MDGNPMPEPTVNLDSEAKSCGARSRGFPSVFNNYGMGTDDVGAPLRSRIHTDDSFELREYNQPDKFLDMMAMSFTGDLGCEYGGGLDCFNDKNGEHEAGLPRMDGLPALPVCA